MAWSGNDSNPDLAVAMPHRGGVSFDWAIRFHSLRLPDHTVTSKNIAPIDLAREESVEAAMDTGAKWIMLLDTDVLPPRDVFLRLRQHDLDVVSGLYFAKKKDPHPAMWKVNEKGALSPVVKWADGAIVDVDAIGLGCTLVKRRVFEDMERPWFRWTQGYDEHPWDAKNITGQIGIGEDFFFCHKAKKAGYRIYVDTAIKCEHEMSGLLDQDGYRPISKRNKDDSDNEEDQ